VTSHSAQHRRGAHGLSSLLAALSLSCLGYSDTAPEAPEVARPAAPTEEMGEAPEDTGAVPSVSAPVAFESATPDASDAPAPSPVEGDLRLGHTLRFDGYLMDREQRPLYMFAEDVAGSAGSACLDTCAGEWPPFDLGQGQPEPGILANELTRFHRQDGRWQSAYKGHPLYYRSAEEGLREVSADGRDGRWFVARDYLAFIAVDGSFAAAGSERFGAGFLTNGFGRALYVCFDDTPASADMPPVSACVGDCARRHPLWSVSEAGRTTILPSVLDTLDIAAFERPDGALQLTLRGWPLYYFSGDERPGDVQGQNQSAWRAIDPLHFGKQDAESEAALSARTKSPRRVQAMRH
jgi:predicted lipoprotein with Yx(FWY)xxD motif